MQPMSDWPHGGSVEGEDDPTMLDATGKRLISVDVLRGLAVMGMILVNSAAAMFYDARVAVYAPLLHAHWDGLMIADVVFPAFLFLMGVSIPIAFGYPDTRATPNGRVVRRIAARAFRLFLIGFVLSNLGWLADTEGRSWRLWGVLQRIGLVYAACAILFLSCGPRVRLILIAVALIAYWPIVLLPALDGLPTDLWIRGHNFVGSVDRVMLGAGGHNYVPGPAGYDPEGLLGTLPAIAHGLIGVAIGERLARREPGSARALAIAGAAMLAAGLAWSPVFPIVKDIWSSPFVLVTCGITTLLLAGAHATLDRANGEPGWPATIAIAFGVNAIAAYVLHETTAGVVAWDAIMLPYRAAVGVLPPAAASLLPILCYMALIWWAMAWLRRKNWIIKV